MKLLSWNVNGIRSVAQKGFLNWFEDQAADVVCLQEIKAQADQVPEELKNPLRYHSYFCSAQKPGYSGLALYTKTEPLSVSYGLGVPEFDSEGRVLIAEFPDWTLVNTYFPNSQRDHARLPYKLKFCQAILGLCESYRRNKRNVVVTGDFNIAHKEIDLKNPKSNQDNAGFLPEERAWMDSYVQAGYVDTFRQFNPEGGNYTWWSYRPGIRQRNIGWRLDYFFINPELQGRLKGAAIQSQVLGSDHCPVLLELKS